MKLRLLLPTIPRISIVNVFPATGLSDADERHFRKTAMADVFYETLHLLIERCSVFLSPPNGNMHLKRLVVSCAVDNY